MIKIARSTVYNQITSSEKLEQVNPENKELGEDWLEYLESIDRSPQSIVAYRSDLNIFWYGIYNTIKINSLLI